MKGETHAATLLVETFIKPKHDLAAIVPVLAGEKHGADLDADDITHCLRAFVAVTRPSDLVCVAIFEDHVSSAQVEGLVKNGWNVERLG